MSDDKTHIDSSDDEKFDIEEFKKTLEHGHLGIPTEYDHEYRPITITDFVKDVFLIDLNKIKNKILKSIK